MTETTTTGESRVICSSCGTIVDWRKRFLTGIFKAIGAILLWPVVIYLLVLLLGRTALHENSMFLAIVLVVIGIPMVGKMIADAFKRACPVCDSRQFIALSTDEGRRLLRERPAASVLAGHTGKISALVTLADGRLASAASDKTIRVWDAVGGRGPVTLTRDVGEVVALAAMPDGRVASAEKDGSVRVWSTDDAGQSVLVARSSSRVKSLAALPDGRLAWAGKGWLSIGDAAKPGQEATTYELGKLGPGALVALRDGRIAAGGWDGLQVVDPSSGDAPVTKSSAMVNTMLLLDDGRLALGQDNLTILVHAPDLSGAPEVVRAPGSTENASVRGLAQLTDGRLASYETRLEGKNLIRVWDLESKDNVVVNAEGATMAALPDGRLATSTREKSIHLREVPVQAKPQ